MSLCGEIILVRINILFKVLTLVRTYFIVFSSYTFSKMLFITSKTLTRKIVNFNKGEYELHEYLQCFAITWEWNLHSEVNGSEGFNSTS